MAHLVLVSSYSSIHSISIVAQAGVMPLRPDGHRVARTLLLISIAGFILIIWGYEPAHAANPVLYTPADRYAT